MSDLALRVAAAKAGVDLAAGATRTPRAGVFLFDPGRKLMTTVHRVGDGFEACMKGSPQAVPGRCADACWDGRTVSLDDGPRAVIGRRHGRSGAAGARRCLQDRRFGAGRPGSHDQLRHAARLA